MNPSTTPLSLKDWLLFAALAVVSTAALGFVDLRPRDATAGVVVVFPPWRNGAAAIVRATAAGASLVRVGRYPFIVVVRPLADGFTVRALRQGALAVLDPAVFGGCLSRTPGAS